jgi:hypothetical protein
MHSTGDVWALSEQMLGGVAVPTENLVARWEIFAQDPGVLSDAASMLLQFSGSGAIVVDVVERQRHHFRLTTTGAFRRAVTVVREHTQFDFVTPPLSQFTCSFGVLSSPLSAVGVACGAQLVRRSARLTAGLTARSVWVRELATRNAALSLGGSCRCSCHVELVSRKVGSTWRKPLVISEKVYAVHR